AVRVAVRTARPAAPAVGGRLHELGGRQAGGDGPAGRLGLLRRVPGGRLPHRPADGGPATLPPLQRGAGTLFAVPDNVAVHREQHAALRGLVSAAAAGRLPRFRPGRQPADRLHAARAVGDGAVFDVHGPQVAGIVLLTTRLVRVEACLTTRT